MRVERSKQAEAWQHLYRSKHWRRLRAKQLDKHPLCQCPHCREGKGQFTEATEVHHRIKHNGNPKLFFDPHNLLSYSKQCHDAFQQSAERGGHGFNKGCDASGQPLNIDHAWYSR